MKSEGINKGSRKLSDLDLYSSVGNEDEKMRNRAAEENTQNKDAT
jgi:hypothetical protein